ncbi:ATPase [Arenibacter sp. S6351L]|uniref:ATPase n=1 Tax=Arenibacter sp. S6351L TaxID=2926407 RepID=UPI001FF2B431|nr:ATPase [Arenibacter sp. S6351L]MCK0135302.1 ATPase [Arenibacter sp. S6351L]
MGNHCNRRADQRPHILVENGVEYCLGNFDGKRIDYDFSKVLTYLEAKGRSLFEESFKVRGEDRGTFLKLCSYMVKDVENCRKMEMDTAKGILLTGPVGCGKTSMMRLVRHLVPHKRTYNIISARNITFAFNHIGYKIIEDYGNGRPYCFDDLGVEPMGRYFGDDCNVMGEVLVSRHELYQKTKILTHITTNLNAEELEERYGKRVRSRMRQMFNLISFDKGTKDKRI